MKKDIAISETIVIDFSEIALMSFEDEGTLKIIFKGNAAAVNFRAKYKTGNRKLMAAYLKWTTLPA